MKLAHVQMIYLITALLVFSQLMVDCEPIRRKRSTPKMVESSQDGQTETTTHGPSNKDDATSKDKLTPRDHHGYGHGYGHGFNGFGFGYPMHRGGFDYFDTLW